MKAAIPPRRCASAMTCWQTVVLPEDSGPKISVMRPRGMPPTPRARSRAIDPVGIESTDCRSAEPSFMIEPRPNCFSMARIAASTARPRSATALSTPPLRASMSLPVIVIVSSLLVASRRTDEAGPGPRPRGASALVRRLFPAWLALLPDQLRLLRCLGQRRQLGLDGLVLGLLLDFLVGAIPRTHGRGLHVTMTVAVRTSRALYGHFAATHPDGAGAQLGELDGERSGAQRNADPDHEV